MFELFADDSRRSMVNARAHAMRLRSDFIGTEHILLGIIEVGGPTMSALSGVPLADVEREILRITGALAAPPPAQVQMPFSPNAKKAIEQAAALAEDQKATRILPGHLLVGLLRAGQGIAFEVLAGLGDAKRLESLTVDAISGGRRSGPGAMRRPE